MGGSSGLQRVFTTHNCLTISGLNISRLASLCTMDWNFLRLPADVYLKSYQSGSGCFELSGLNSRTRLFHYIGVGYVIGLGIGNSI